MVVVEQGKIARNAGATWIMGDPNNPDGYEVKHTDLSGIIFDIAAHGWAGSQKEPGTEDDVDVQIRGGGWQSSTSAGPGRRRRSPRCRRRTGRHGEVTV